VADKELKSGIYKILNIITGKFYIGSAVNFYQRWHLHKHHLNKNIHHSITLQRSWNLHGADAFIFEILEYCNKEKLNEREQFWLDWFKPYNPNVGYNINSIVGSSLGIKRSDEAKAKMRAARLGKKFPNTRKPMSEEVKQKIAKTLTGRKQSKEANAKRAIAMSGFKHTEETKEKISKGKTGTKLSESHKANLSLAQQQRWDKYHANK
jgi:group I intron endonuclease